MIKLSSCGTKLAENASTPSVSMEGKYLVVMSEVGLPGEFTPGLSGPEVPVLAAIKLLKKPLATLAKVASPELP